ncbi:hypothetical protein KDL01_06315 [Actinospica durhamensis]|uniref:Uncharacterized protein n=1 Tax=Actinospica durhamensis TaxID=1508375 RepID=A0A941ELR2_9ACTN|nr:hypothetical protein [Actinospica durhamensis]MBR7832867.1 hypothetical protein [Actinospica durhamensis]
MIPVSLLNFLSGLTAGAGINLLTSIEGGSNASHSEIMVDSAVWVVVAIFLAYAAHLTEAVEKEASLVIDGSLTPDEKRQVHEAHAASVRWRYRISLIVSGALSVLAILLIPGI